MDERAGGCSCGAVRLAASGPPLRVGLCHCTTCRRETGGPFSAYLVWKREQVALTGAPASWTERSFERFFCGKCGSALFGREQGSDEIEIRLGCLDSAPSGVVPAYELFVGRREAWLPAVPGARQFAGDRDG